MLDLEARFSPKIIPASVEYPYGKLKPNTTPADNDGTPVAADTGNDIEGFKQAAITRASIEPSGSPDTAINSQLLDSLDKRYLEIDYQAWTFATGGLLTNCSQAVKHTDNKWYSWSGVFPDGGKVVSAGTDPTAATGYVPRIDAGLRGELAAVGSTVLISGVEARVVAGASDIVRTVTVNDSSGTQTVIAEQIGRSLLFTAATAVTMPALASLNGVTGHYRIMAGDNPITLTRSDGLLFTVRGSTVASVTIPSGSDCYVVYDSEDEVYVYGLETYETIVKSYCLVNALGTGAPNEIVSAALPANCRIGSRYVLANPFGINTPVTGWVEIFVNNKWSQTGFVYASNGGYGVSFNYVQGEGIIIQTGGNAVVSSFSYDAGGGHGRANEGGTVTSAPCRVFIQKLGA